MVFAKTKFIIIMGFAMILLIFAALVSVWVTTQKHQRERLLKIDNLRQATKSIGNMRQAALRRSLLLHEMSLKDEYFDREDRHQEFVSQAGVFIQSRDELLSLSLSDSDKLLWGKLRELILINEKGQSHVARLLLDGRQEAGRALLSNEIIPNQQKIMEQLSEMFQNHNLQVAREFRIADEKQTSAYRIIIILAAAALCISIAIIVFIVRSTTRIQRDLAKADEARIANRMKSEFLANMSHEIRTPLTSIIGYSQIALNTDQSREERIDGQRAVLRNGKHLLRIINEILDLSKIEAGKFDLEMLPVSTFALMQDVCDIAMLKAKDKGLQCGVNFVYPLPETFKTDPVRLKQILLNLMINAVKFTDEGHVYVKVWCDRYANKMIFEVEDTGIGIDAGNQEKIFAAFTQAEVSTSRKYGGTGLGLTLSRQLCVLLGGGLTVRSKPGQGSTFTASVDTDSLEHIDFVYDGNEVKSRSEDTDMVIPSLEGNVLLVDDVPDNQKLMLYLISKTGAWVDVAENGLQALEMMRTKQYDLVLMDMQMPVMDGLQATRALRKDGDMTPVVALTANAYKSDRADCSEAGCDDFLSKPVDMDELGRVLKVYLKTADHNKKGEEGHTVSEFNADPELMQIVDNFVRYLPQHLANINGLYSTRHWEELGYTLHSLKGSSGSMGFPVLAEHIAGMETCLKVGEYYQLDKQIREFERLVSKISASDEVNSVI